MNKEIHKRRKEKFSLWMTPYCLSLLLVIIFSTLNIRSVASDTATICIKSFLNERRLPGAVVSFKGGKTGSYLLYKLSDSTGTACLSLIIDSLPGKIQISALQSKPYSFTLDESFDFRKIFVVNLTADTTILQPVEIKGKWPVKIKGDTTVYNVQKFTTGTEQNIAELIKRLPGFAVDAQGNIKFKGRIVERVLFNNADLVGADYQQMIKTLSPKGIEEIEAIENFEDDDDDLASFFGNRRTAINLKYADSVAAKLQGQLSASVGIPFAATDNDAQLLQLGKGTKWLGIAGYAANVDNSNAGALGAELKTTEVRPEFLNTTPLVSNWPQPNFIPQSSFLIQPQSSYLQASINNGKSSGFKWRGQIQLLTDAAAQQSNTSTALVIGDSSIVQNETNEQMWNQRRLNVWWRGSGTLTTGKQLLIEAKLKGEHMHNNGFFTFQKAAGIDLQHQTKYDGMLRAVLNLKNDSANTSRTELLMYARGFNDDFIVESDSVVTAMLRGPSENKRLKQVQGFYSMGLEAKHQIRFRSTPNWRIEWSGTIAEKRQNLQWVTDSVPLSTILSSQLSEGTSTLYQTQLRIGYRLGFSRQFFIFPSIVTQLGTLQQHSAKANTVSHPFFLVIPSLDGHYTGGKGWNINLSINGRNSFAEWPFVLPGTAMNGRTSLIEGMDLPMPKKAFSGSLSISKMNITGKIPSVFLFISHNVSPIFSLPVFVPGSIINKALYNRFDRNRAFTTVSLRISSPLANTTFSYSLQAQLLSFANYNQPFGVSQQLQSTQQQFTGNVTWRPISLLSISLANTLQRQLQRVEGNRSGNGIVNTAEVTIAFAKTNHWSIDLAGGYFYNLAGASKASMPVFRANGVLNVRRIAFFGQVSNLFNEQRFTTIAVGNGRTNIFGTSVLPRYLLFGLRCKL